MSKHSKDAFLERLEKARSRPLNEKLSALITKNDYIKIIDFFLTRKHTPLINMFSELTPGEAFRLDKKSTGLPRTLNILCSQDGELKLIVETKSKLANNRKQKLPKAAGTYKSGKPAWRIDSEKEIEYFNLVAKLRSQNALQGMQNEADLSQYIGSDKIDILELGPQFSKRDLTGREQEKISAYSIRAAGDLHSVLGKEQHLLSEKQKNNMMLDLLEGLQVLGRHGMIHQDLKPQNILAYGNAKEGYRLKISDLGLAEHERDPNALPGATAGYQSPEISSYYAHPDTAHHDYFNSRFAKDSLGYFYFQRLPRMSIINVNKPHRANDAWAMGLVLCQIRHGTQPKTPQEVADLNDPLIQGLLHPDRSKRLTADEATAVLRTQIAQAQPRQPAPPPIPQPRTALPVHQIHRPRENPPVDIQPLPPIPRPHLIFPIHQMHQPKANPPVEGRQPLPPVQKPSGFPIAAPRQKGNIGDQAKKQAQVDAAALRTAQLLNALLGESIKDQYQKQRKNSGLGKWIVQQANYKNKARDKQIEDIMRTLSQLKGDKALSSQEKATAAYHAFSQLQSQIKNEGNLFPSALNKVCEEGKEKLRTLFPHLDAPVLPREEEGPRRPPRPKH